MSPGYDGGLAEGLRRTDCKRTVRAYRAAWKRTISSAGTRPLGFDFDTFWPCPHMDFLGRWLAGVGESSLPGVLPPVVRAALI
jgi:hypothetical protein